MSRWRYCLAGALLILAPAAWAQPFAPPGPTQAGLRAPVQCTVAENIAQACSPELTGVRIVIIDGADSTECGNLGDAGEGSSENLCRWSAVASAWVTDDIAGFAGGGTHPIAAGDYAAGSIAIADIAAAAKTGDDGELVTGTKGATNDCAKWDANGDLVTAGAACAAGGTHPIEAGDYAAGSIDDDDINAAAAIASSKLAADVLVEGDVGNGLRMVGTNLHTDSREQYFLFSGNLACGTDTAGAMQTQNGPLQYCMNNVGNDKAFAAYADGAGLVEDFSNAADLDAAGDVADASHTHTVANLSDTTASAAQLDTVTDGSEADTEHVHTDTGHPVLANHIDTLTEIAAAIKTGTVAGDLVTGTKGATNDCAKWDANGDLVSAGAACGAGGGGTHPIEAGDYDAGSIDDDDINAAAAIASSKLATDVLVESDAGVGLEVNAGQLDTKSDEAGFLKNLGSTTDLSCGSGDEGKIAVNSADVLQYCDGGDILRYAAKSTESGAVQDFSQFNDSDNFGNIDDFSNANDLDIAGNVADASHSHTVANLSDTTASAAQLDTVTDGSEADTEHVHTDTGHPVLANHIDTLTEIAAAIKTGTVAGDLVTGTKGATDDCAKWDANGDLVSAGGVCGVGGGGTHPIEAGDYDAGSIDDDDINAAAAIASSKLATDVLVEADAGDGLEVNAGQLDTKSDEAGFLEDLGAGDLTCGGSNAGLLAVNDADALQYCDGAATPARKTVAFGNDAGQVTDFSQATDLNGDGEVADASHTHTVANLSDTSASAGELDNVTDGSNADTEHVHTDTGHPVLADHIDDIAEVATALKSGDHEKLITGTASTLQCAYFDLGGDLVGSGTGLCGAAAADAISVLGVGATGAVDFQDEGDLDPVLCTGSGTPDSSCAADDDIIFRINANAKTGIDPEVVSGTATNGECAQFDSNGDLVGSGAPCATGVSDECNISIENAEVGDDIMCGQATSNFSIVRMVCIARGGGVTDLNMQMYECQPAGHTCVASGFESGNMTALVTEYPDTTGTDSTIGDGKFWGIFVDSVGSAPDWVDCQVEFTR